jgi:MFS family permease
MKGNIKVITVTRLIYIFSNFLVAAYFPLYVLALGGSNTSIGFINAIGSLAGLLTIPMAGYIADHKGRLKLIYAGSYLQAFMVLFNVFAPNWIFLAVGRFLVSLITFHLAAMAAILADSTSPKQRGMVFAVYAMASSTGIVSPFIGGYAIGSYGVVYAMRLMYAFVFVGSIVVAVLRHKFLKETFKGAASSVSLRNLPLLLKTSYNSVWDALKWMPKNLRSLAFISTANIFFNSIATSFWIVYASTIIKISIFEWGIIEVAMGVLKLALLPLIGSLVDKQGKRKCIIGALALSIIPTFFFVYCKNFYEVLTVILVIGFADSLLATSCFSLMADIVPSEKRGRIMASFGQGTITIRDTSQNANGFITTIATMAGSAISGYIFNFNPIYPWFILSTALGLFLILSILFVHEPEKAEV